MKISVKIEVGSKTYEAVLNRQIEISCDGAWAGSGRWDEAGGRIVECTATIPDEAYEAIETAIGDAIDAERERIVGQRMSALGRRGGKKKRLQPEQARAMARARWGSL